MQTHPVRALAFHHEKGFEAQRQLALDFAGEGGRIATVEDIVHAQLRSRPQDLVNQRVFITGSYVYCGSRAGKKYLVFAHGNGPEPIKTGQLRYFRGSQYDSIRERESRPDHPELSWGIEPQEFENLLSGKYGPVGVVDLSTYTSKAKRTDKKASNRYTYGEARKDEIIRAVFGKYADAFFAHLHKRQVDWLKGEPRSARVMLPMFANFLRIGGEWSIEKAYVPEGYAVACPLTLEPGGFYVDKWHPIFSRRKKRQRDKKKCYEMSISTNTNSGIDDLGGPAFFMVGIRDKEPLESVEASFGEVVLEVHKHWPTFVQPLAEVPADPYIGIKPDGSRDRPYYILNRWHTQPEVTGRIKEDGTASNMPEYRIKKVVRIEGPRSVLFKRAPYNFYEGFPYTGMWEALKAAMPKGANAIACGSSCHSGDTIEADVAYWHIEVDPEPFHFLTECGDRLFTQYIDSDRLAKTGRPYRLVEDSVELGGGKRVRIPKRVHEALDGGRNMRVLYSHLIAQAPESANAVLLRDVLGGETMHVDVGYYRVTLGDQAFRPFSDLRADFDWQLERRAQAGLLKAA
jgi:hypothetical protein